MRQVEGSPQAEKVRELIKAKIDRWLEEARKPSRQLGYKTKRDGSTVGLLKQAGAGAWEEFTALNSLRGVEPSVGLILGVKDR